MQKLNRRKFLQLCAIGAVVATRWLVTGGKKTEIEQEEHLIGAIKGRKIYSTPVTYDNVETMLEKTHSYNGKTVEFTQTPEDPDSWQSLSTAPVEFELQKSMHVSFNEDRTAWKFTRRKSPPFVYPGPAFVILEPSEQMVKELEVLKAQSISILATYHD